ncbi:MAG TPA: flagellar basal-body rod protein FlgF [Methylomirabilota bacterium]|nr:flagellar basal-body rod protein FlgF [Methylomirabilota bacterium]
MDSGFYSTFTGFSTRLDALEVVANNLANANTTGYKAQVSFYRAMPAWLQESLTTPLNQVVNRFGVLGGAQLDLTPGNLEKTENPTDVALQGAGFFNVQTKAGVRFTRDGNFQLNAKRQLVTGTGDPVLGEQGPLQIPSGQITISEDGTISVDGGVVAKLKVTEFVSATDLKPEGNSYFASKSAGKLSPDPRVMQGSLETSNANPVKATVSLIELQRTAQMMEKALSIFHNEFNKTAAQDLPRD